MPLRRFYSAFPHCCLTAAKAMRIFLFLSLEKAGKSMARPLCGRVPNAATAAITSKYVKIQY